MKKLLTIVVLFLTFAASAQTVTSHFTESKFIKASGKTVTAEGDLKLFSADKMEMNYTNPAGDYFRIDGKMMSIAAASVLAKTHRDEYMRRIALEYPHYGWEKNKGYPTRDHRAAIVAHGISPYHRKSFNLVGQLSLFD